MPRLPLSYYGDPVLRAKAAPIAEFGTDDLRSLITDLFETCGEEEGVGLAAPQVGVSQRIFVLDCAEFPAEPDCPKHRLAVINPEIVERHGTVESEEGCLSMPGIMGTVRRSQRVKLKGYDAEGEPLELEAEGLVSRCIQHEVDHLDGILFIDRLSNLKRQLLKRQLEEIAAEHAAG